jgi:uncharacterized protein YbjT (DUF2867 family)
VILVAGGSGFIGAAVVRRLVGRGSEVAVMTAHPQRSRERIERLGATAVPGDVLDPDSLVRAVEGVDAVIQTLTFPTFPTERPRKRYTFEEFDHLGTERLATASAKAGAQRYVFASGVGAAPHAAEVWSRAKWFGEEAVRSSGIPHAIIRPSWVYGPEDVALNKFVAFHRWLPFVPVIGDGSQRLQPVSIDDVAAVLAIAASPTGPTGTFEIGGPHVLTMNEVLRRSGEGRSRWFISPVSCRSSPASSCRSCPSRRSLRRPSTSRPRTPWPTRRSCSLSSACA